MHAIVVCAHHGAWREDLMEATGRVLLHAAYLPSRRCPVELELDARAVAAYDRLACDRARPTLGERLAMDYPAD